MPSPTASTRPTCSATGARRRRADALFASLSQLSRSRGRVRHEPTPGGCDPDPLASCCARSCCGCAVRCRRSAPDRAELERQFRTERRVERIANVRQSRPWKWRRGHDVDGVICRCADAMLALASDDSARSSSAEPIEERGQRICDGSRSSRRCAMSTASSLARAIDRLLGCDFGPGDRRFGFAAQLFAISSATIARAVWPSPPVPTSAPRRSIGPLCGDFCAALSASARARRLRWRAARASASSLSASLPAARRRCPRPAERRNGASSQMRTRTLTVCSASVHQSMCMVSLDEGIGEQQQQRDHQAVDRHGLDHRESDERACAIWCPRPPAGGRSHPWPRRPRVLRRAPDRSRRTIPPSRRRRC